MLLKFALSKYLEKNIGGEWTDEKLLKVRSLDSNTRELPKIVADMASVAGT